MLKACQQLEANPKKLDIFKKIINFILSATADHQQIVESLPILSELIKKYFKQISSEKQQQTYSLVESYTLSIIKAIIAVTDVDDTIEIEYLPEIFQGLAKFIKITPQKIQLESIAYLYDQAINISKVDSSYEKRWSSLQSCSLLSRILKKIDKNKIRQNFTQVSNFLMSLSSRKQLECEPIFKNESNEDVLKQFREIFQTVFLDVLQQLQNRTIQDKMKIYRKMGEKVFSKMSNCLILSDYLLRKFHSENQNPTIQIEVLSSIFILVGKEGLELQQFYETLQRMLARERAYNESLFRQKNSKRFLKLLQSAMRSSRVPFSKILSLCKLIIQKVLYEDTQFSFWALSFFFNLVKKHRQLQKNLQDNFPELKILQHHYSPKIRQLVQKLDQNLDKVEYLEIESFQRLRMKKLCENKAEKVCGKLQDNSDQIQFMFVKKDIVEL